jgi:hypothetical protein
MSFLGTQQGSIITEPEDKTSSVIEGRQNPRLILVRLRADLLTKISDIAKREERRNKMHLLIN